MYFPPITDPAQNENAVVMARKNVDITLYIDITLYVDIIIEIAPWHEADYHLAQQ